MEEQYKLTKGQNLNQYINEACENFKSKDTPLHYIRTLHGISDEEKEEIWRQTYLRHKGRFPTKTYSGALAELTKKIEKREPYIAEAGAVFSCERKCLSGGKLYDVGDTYVAGAGVEVPHHFKLIKGAARKGDKRISAP